MEKVRPSFLLSLITVTGLILSAWLILYGLQLRFFGAFVTPQGILRILDAPGNVDTLVNGGGNSG